MRLPVRHISRRNCAGSIVLAQEFVAFHSGCEARLLLSANHFADATQAHFRARSRRLRQRDQVLDCRADRNRRLGYEQDPAGTHVSGLTFSLGFGRAHDNLEWEAQIEALILSLFHHSDTECISGSIQRQLLGVPKRGLL